MTEIFLFQACQRAVFGNLIEKVEQGGGKGIIAIAQAKPGDRLFIRNVQRHGNLRMNALEKINRDGVRHGICQLAVRHLFKQGVAVITFIHTPAEIRVLTLFQGLQIVSRDMAGGDSQLFSRKVGK